MYHAASRPEQGDLMWHGYSVLYMCIHILSRVEGVGVRYLEAELQM